MSEVAMQRVPKWVQASASVIPLLPFGRYRLLHWLGSRKPNEFIMQVPKRFGGFRFRCNLQDTISREVCFTGQYEPQETALVGSILREGLTFVDVGANWGYFTLLALGLVGRKGRVISLEPDPRLFSALSDNVARTGMNQVTLLQLAAGDRECMLPLSGYDDSEGNFGVSRIVGHPDGFKNLYEVAAERLDTILDKLEVGSVDLMKMDIEGAEAFAIPGLENALRRNTIKRLLLELHPHQIAEHKSTPLRVVKALTDAGYEAFRVDHSSSATRRAAYSRKLRVSTILASLKSLDDLDDWPHLLFAAPDVQPTF